MVYHKHNGSVNKQHCCYKHKLTLKKRLAKVDAILHTLMAIMIFAVQAWVKGNNFVAFS
jgi:hypothetical protein